MKNEIEKSVDRACAGIPEGEDFQTLPALTGLTFAQALDVCRDGEYHEVTHPALGGHFQHHPTGRMVYVVEGIAQVPPLFISDFDRDDWYVGRRLGVYGDDDQYHVASRSYQSVLAELLLEEVGPTGPNGVHIRLMDGSASKADVIAALSALDAGRDKTEFALDPDLASPELRARVAGSDAVANAGI